MPVDARFGGVRCREENQPQEEAVNKTHELALTRGRMILITLYMTRNRSADVYILGSTYLLARKSMRISVRRDRE